jgi:hypothetical protein
MGGMNQRGMPVWPYQDKSLSFLRLSQVRVLYWGRPVRPERREDSYTTVVSVHLVTIP